MKSARLYLGVIAIAMLIAAIPLDLWGYERYKTQAMLNNRVVHATEDYARAMHNLNDELDRFKRGN